MNLAGFWCRFSDSAALRFQRPPWPLRIGRGPGTRELQPYQQMLWCLKFPHPNTAQIIVVFSSVSDPLSFFTDPDPTQKPKADPDPDPGEILHAYNEK